MPPDSWCTSPKAKAKPAVKPSPKPSASPGTTTSSHSAASCGSTKVTSYTSSWKGRRKGLWWKRRRVLLPWRRLELHWWRIPTTAMFGDGGMQSLLKIEIYALASDSWKESEPANIFLMRCCLREILFCELRSVAVSQLINGRERKILTHRSSVFLSACSDEVSCLQRALVRNPYRNSIRWHSSGGYHV